MATSKKVLGNMIAQVGGKFFSVLASLVVMKIVSSFGTAFYGNYVTTYEFLSFFGIIADAGLFSIAVREMSKEPKKMESVFANTLSLRLILTISVTILAGTIAQFVSIYPPEVRLGIWITGLSMAFTIVAGTLSSVLQTKMKIQKFSISFVIGKIILALLIFFISKSSGVFPDLFFAFLWSGVLANFIFCTVVYYFVSKEIKIRLGFDIEWWKKTLKVSLPYGLALILQTLYLRLDILLISLLLGSSSVGIYGIPARILENLLVIGIFFGQAILPKLSSEEDKKEQFENSLNWGIQILLLISLPIIIGITKFAPDVIQLLSSDEYLHPVNSVGSDKILFLLIFSVFFAYLNQLFSYSLVSRNKQNYLLLVNGGALTLNACLNFYLLPRFGIVAAALTTIFCEIFVFFLLFKNITKHFKLHIPINNIALILLSNAILFIEIYLTPIGENFTLSLAIGFITYSSIIFLFRNNLKLKETNK